MEEEFYAIIKLVSGEEVFSKVCPCEENEKIILILDNPVTIEYVNIQQMGITTLRLNPWIKFTEETMFIIDFDKIITISEVNDKKILNIYNKFLEGNGKTNKFNKNKKNKLSGRMGYLSSIADARIILEKIYNKNI
jgi:hypothetical protein